MPSTQLNVKLGSDNSIFNHDVPAHVKRSVFNFSRKRDFTIDPGPIVPVDLIETVPGDSFEISVNYLLKSMPLEVAPFTNYRIRTHWYYCRLIDLWKGASTFITKGRSGSLSLSIPKIKPYHGVKIAPSFSTGFYYDVPQSLLSYLGLPPRYVAQEEDYSEGFYPYDQWRLIRNYTGSNNVRFNSEIFDDTEVNALPFFMYQKIYRMAYTVPNLLQDNKVWFPDDISDGWRINFNADNLLDRYSDNRAPIFRPDGFSSIPVDDPNFEFRDSPSPLVSDNGVNITLLRFGLYEDDRFTTALPWAQRGSAPTIDFNADVTIPAGSNFNVGASLPIIALNDETNDGTVFVYYNDSTGAGVSPYIGVRHAISGSSTNVNSALRASGSVTVRQPERSATVTGIGFNLNQFRSLIALSVWQERNARTQGSYNETIFAHFNSSPKHQDYEPVYIGGTSDVINFSEVIQTSTSQDSTPQGTSTGLAASQNGGNVGYFRAPDYGYIMGLMIIQPETVYAKNVEKLWFRSVMEDFFMPEYEGLGLQEVTKNELWLAFGSDKKLFGYQERNTEYKTRSNQAIGFFSVPSSVDRMFSAYSQARFFTSEPFLSHQFVVMSNLRRDWLAVPSYPAFRCSFASNVKVVRPMAYKSVPNTFGV